MIIEKFAIISVSDKTDIINFSRIINNLGYKIISTGGTARILKENNIPVIPIQDVTGNPESFDGRMKTISFQIESGILFDRSNKIHINEALDFNIKPIDLVICNLYPFEKTVSNKNATLKEAIENIDVGGPTMLRAAAKNFKHVLPICDPKDYGEVAKYLKKNNVSEKFRRNLAAKTFRHLSFYDSQIASFLSDENFPKEITLPGRKLYDLRYGENPHQKAAFYIRPGFPSTLSKLEKKWGRDLSLVNLTDINAGLESVRIFKNPSAVVIKHNSPSGIAFGETPDIALKRAIDSDPESAFGGIIVLNTSIDIKTVEVIGTFKDERKGNIDIFAAPSIDRDSISFLKTLRKSMGIYTFGEIALKPDPINIKWVDGGFILQESDINIDKSFKNWKIVTKKKPNKLQMRQMEIAWKFISRIKSNSVIIVDEEIPMTRGIGSGQTSRIRSTKLALEQAGALAKRAILASDSFFPFGDSVKLAAEYGVAAIIQQGGSIRDQESIAEADKAGITMVFTGQRAFWH